MVEIGFIQGRLSPIVQGKPQAFPWTHWWEEFETAHQYGFTRMEWTLDNTRLEKNPLMSPAGRQSIQDLMGQYTLEIHSLAGDCFMQAPFWKAMGTTREYLIETLQTVLTAAATVDIRWIVVPLVDNGRIETPTQKESLLQGITKLRSLLKAQHQKIVFESDFPPLELREFIEQLDPDCFGINYDSGNSAALGYDVAQEIEAYGDRIDNVHIKDRLLGGTSVPLGMGNADLPRVCALLKQHNYSGQYILQTARATDGDHVGALCRYRTQVQQWLA